MHQGHLLTFPLINYQILREKNNPNSMFARDRQRLINLRQKDAYSSHRKNKFENLVKRKPLKNYC